MFYSTVKTILGILLKGIFKFNVKGLENVPKEGKLVLCSNHASNWDPLLVSIVFPRNIAWMAKKELFKSKILSFLMLKLGAFPVDRQETDITSIKRALRVLKEDRVLGIFPEGTRVEGLDLNNAKPGVALMAMKSKSKVIPLYINGTYKPFSTINITIGKPIDFSENLEKKLSNEMYTEISKEILEKIYGLGG